MKRTAFRYFSGGGPLQLASLPEAVACRNAYCAEDFASCLGHAERALGIASSYLPGSRDFTLFATVAGRCCWRLGRFPAASTHFEAASAADARLRPAAVRARAEVAMETNLDTLQAEWSELNHALGKGGCDSLPRAVLEAVRESGPEPHHVAAWVSVGEAAALGRLELAASEAESLLTKVLEASVPNVPSFSTLRPRALQSLGTLHLNAQHAVTAEGLFRAAKDAWAECVVSPRGMVPRAQGGLAYGKLLNKWEKREREGAAEIALVSELLGQQEISEPMASWAALVLPPLQTANIIEELWTVP